MCPESTYSSVKHRGMHKCWLLLLECHYDQGNPPLSPPLEKPVCCVDFRDYLVNSPMHPQGPISTATIIAHSHVMADSHSHGT